MTSRRGWASLLVLAVLAGCTPRNSAVAQTSPEQQPPPARAPDKPRQEEEKTPSPTGRAEDSDTIKAPAAAAAEGTFVPVMPGERVLRPEDLKALAWRSIGPANMGGRVADVCFAPGNPKTFYVAYGTGGLWKTTNAGVTFSPVFDKYETSSIGSVVVCDAPPDWPGWKEEQDTTGGSPVPQPSPSQPPAQPKAEPTSPDVPKEPIPSEPMEKERAGQPPTGATGESPVPQAPVPQPGVAAAAEAEKDKGKAKIIWVGTGEGNGRNSSSWGHGVYRSTDGGGEFKHLGLADSHDIPRLAVDPRNPDVCYVAALGHLWGPNGERGLYKTTDGGKSWNAVLQIDEHTGCCDVIINPQNPDIVYAAMYMRRRTPWSFQSGGPNGGIYRSTDAGATWTKLAGGLPPQTGRIGLDIYARDPRILYAVLESDAGGWGVEPFDNRSKAGGVFRSEDGGETWTRMSELAPRVFYFCKIRIDPVNDQRVYLLGWTVGISDDGGKNFRAGGSKVTHVDMHAMAIDPADPEHILLGNDGGVYVSYDKCRTWDFFNTMAVGQFYNVAFDLSDPYRIGGGLQDNGSWIGPSETIWNSSGDFMGRAGGITNADWWFINNGDGFHVAFDPQDRNIVYAESQGGELVRIHLDTGVRKRLKPSPKEGQPRFRFNWNSPFFISPHEPTTLYLAGNYVFKLTERGEKWQRISEDLSQRDVSKIESVGSDAETHGTVVSLAESPLRPGMLWAGTDDGLIHVTTDDGQSWSNVTPPQVNGWYISRIEASHHDPDVAYASIDAHRSNDFDPHLIMTTDGGRSWTSIEGDLPKGASIKCVREDRFNPNVLYVGTERAAYVSIDRGGRWVKLNGDSLPTVAVDDLAQHPRERDLIAGTHGRSIYVLDDASPLSELTPQVVSSPFHLFDMLPGQPRLYLDYEGIWSDRMFAARNPAMGAYITYWIRDFNTEKVSVSIEDRYGYKVRELTGSNTPGLNRVVWDLQMEKHDRYESPDAWLGQTPFVPAGEYKVTVSFGKHKAEKKLLVLEKPGGEDTP